MVQIKRSLAMAVLMLMALSVLFQVWQVWRFVQQGPRFTAQDGTALCQRVRELERVSYGYRDTGKTPLPCDYVERK